MRGHTPIQPYPPEELERSLKWFLNDLYGPLQRVLPDAARAYCPESSEGHEWNLKQSATTHPMTAHIEYRCPSCGATVTLDMEITEGLAETGERRRTVVIREVGKLPGLEEQS
jgi:hypothetical protein